MSREAVDELTQRDIQAFMDRFRGREDYFARQMPEGTDGYRPIEAAFDVPYLKVHLAGDDTYGMYVLDSQSCANLVCVDLDIPREAALGIDLSSTAAKMGHLQGVVENITDSLISVIGCAGENLLVEDTGGRGFHIWVFIDRAVPGDDLIRIGMAIRARVTDGFEFFPKQGHLAKGRGLGNLVKLPLGVHKRYGFRSRFVRRIGFGFERIESLVDNLAYLTTVNHISGQALHVVLSTQAPEIPGRTEDYGYAHDMSDARGRVRYVADIEFLTSHCAAIAGLVRRASSGGPLPRSEAFHLANTILSLADFEKQTVELFEKAYGPRFVLRKTQEELAYIRPLHPTSCKTLHRLGLCEEYCCQDVRDAVGDDLRASPTPLSTYLRPSRVQSRIVHSGLAALMQTRDNVLQAYCKLKQYHRDEDMLFFDVFDFTDFEDDLDINTEFIARSMLDTFQDTLDGFDIVPVPKKVGDSGQMEYRNMAYCSVFDAVYHQALFNVAGPILEERMDPSSYGYRLDDESENERAIFRDWRVVYPQFRGDVLNHLARCGNGYYACCDIERFYDNIRHDVLCQQVATGIADAQIAEMVSSLVRSYSAPGKVGLGVPQGPAYARVLANLYLSDFDREMCRAADGYVRYVDDFFVFSRTNDGLGAAMDKAHRLLDQLGLRLPTAEGKKAEVRPATDDTAITAKIDDIQYGIMEEFRHIRTFEAADIRDFYAAAKKHNIDRFGPAVEKVNERAPSICYLVSRQDIAVSQALEREFAFVIEFLVTEGLFYPKRQKFIFGVIVKLLLKHGFSVLDLYSKLEDTHRVYLLLALHTLVERGDASEAVEGLLRELAQESVTQGHRRAGGIALRILSRLGAPLAATPGQNWPMAIALDPATRLDAYHALRLTDYWQCAAVERARISGTLAPTTHYLLRKALLSRSVVANPTHQDNLFIANAFLHQTPLLLLEVARFLPSITEDTHLFRQACKAISAHHNVKHVALFALRLSFRSRYKDASAAEVERLKPLYAGIEDTELREIAMGLVASLLEERPEGTSFLASHALVSDVSGCLVYESHADEDRFIERIPKETLSLYGFENTTRFASVLSDLSARQAILSLSGDPEYETRTAIMSVTYSLDSGYQMPEAPFWEELLSDPVKILKLTEDIYKKAAYFHRLLGHIPYIFPGSIAIDPRELKARFTTVARVFQPFYLVEGERLGVNEGEEIPRAISMYWRACLFGGSREKEEAYFASSNSPEALLLQLVLSKFRSVKPELRYSHRRVKFLLDSLLALRQSARQQEKIVFYLQERLFSTMYHHCEGQADWRSCGKALLQFSTEVLELCQRFRPSVERYTIRDSSLAALGNAHDLSRKLANLAANAAGSLGKSVSQTQFFDLYQTLTYASVLGIEVPSFAKGVSVACEEGMPDVGRIPVGCARVSHAGLTLTLLRGDVGNTNAILDRRQAGKVLVDATSAWSLRQLALAGLLLLSRQKLDGQELRLSNSGILATKTYDSLAECVLGLVPTVERSIAAAARETINCFASPARPPRVMDLEELMGHVKHICLVLAETRKGLGIKRMSGRMVDRHSLPYIIRCRRLAGRKYTFPHALVNRSPLTAELARSCKRCSWDVYRGSPVDVVVPNDRVDKLIGLLRKGKLFGLSFWALLSGKSFVAVMVVYAAVLVAVSALLQGSILGGVLWLLRSFLWALLPLPLVAKFISDMVRKKGNGIKVLLPKGRGKPPG